MVFPGRKCALVIYEIPREKVVLFLLMILIALNMNRGI